MSFAALREGDFFPDYLIGCFLKAVFLFFTHIFFANMNHSCFIKAVTGRNFAKKWSQLRPGSYPVLPLSQIEINLDRINLINLDRLN